MPVIQIHCLGNNGRFGNQLFQYAFARAYAEFVGAELQTPPWIGQVLFKGIQDGPCQGQLRRLAKDRVPQGEVDIDLDGFFQGPQHLRFYNRRWVQRLFVLKDEFQDLDVPHGLVAAHVRQGDYVAWHAEKYASLSLRSYHAAFQLYGIDPESVSWIYEPAGLWPIRWPCPRWKAPCEDLSRFPMSFLPDFMAMMRASHLFRANSTFSWWAAALSPTGCVYSPLVQETCGKDVDAPFVRGNWPACCYLFGDPVLSP